MYDSFSEIDEIENQIAILEEKIVDLEILRNSINELKNLKENEMLVPLGGGVLIKTNLSDEKKLLVNVGANILIYKTYDEALTLINKQIVDLISFQEQLKHELLHTPCENPECQHEH